jgi:MFS family permease
MKAPLTGVFRSLRGFNYRVWVAGASGSNVGTWVQRTAQDWLVFPQLTHHDASAVGLVMALQFGPQLLFLPWTGFAADHFNQHKLLIVTQATMGGLALALGIPTVTDVVRLRHVYIFAFLFGCAAAFDAPVRQTFVAELVGDEDLQGSAVRTLLRRETRSQAAGWCGFHIPSVCDMIDLGARSRCWAIWGADFESDVETAF